MEIIGTLNPKSEKLLEIQDMHMIENLEKDLECFTSLLEKSTQKEKHALKKISNQTALITDLQKENKQLKQENEWLKQTLETTLKNIQDYLKPLLNIGNLEQENINLRKKLDQAIKESNDKILELMLEKSQNIKEIEELKKSTAELRNNDAILTQKLETLNKHMINGFKNTLNHGNIMKIEKLEEMLKIKELELKKFKEEHDVLIKNPNTKNESLNISISNVNNKIIEENSMEQELEKEKELPDVPNKTSRVLRKINKNKNSKDDKKEKTLEAPKIDSLNEDGLIASDDEDDPDYENLTKTKKRKAIKDKKRADVKKVKKNENKDMLMSHKNAILFHLNS